jgi:hypothetical protein
MFNTWLNYIFLILVIASACKSKSKLKCSFLNNDAGTVTIDRTDSICLKLKKLQETGTGISFYISAKLPPNSQDNKIANSFFAGKNVTNNVTVLISFVEKKFSTVYSDFLYSEKFLVNREAFGQYIYDLLKRGYKDDFFALVIGKFEELFVVASELR